MAAIYSLPTFHRIVAAGRSPLNSPSASEAAQNSRECDKSPSPGTGPGGPHTSHAHQIARAQPEPAISPGRADLTQFPLRGPTATRPPPDTRVKPRGTLAAFVPRRCRRRWIVEVRRRVARRACRRRQGGADAARPWLGNRVRSGRRGGAAPPRREAALAGARSGPVSEAVRRRPGAAVAGRQVRSGRRGSAQPPGRVSGPGESGSSPRTAGPPAPSGRGRWPHTPRAAPRCRTAAGRCPAACPGR
jgi:hypothetical protein